MTLIQRNIEIDEEIWSSLKAECIKRNKNLREFAGEILADYVTGSTKARKNKGVKAIIIAAGLSSRLMHLTDDKPKCMLEVGGKTLLQREIDIYKNCGIDDIVVIKGYKKEAINYVGVKYCYNRNYRRNNILESLMYAKGEMEGEIIVSYSDILFRKSVVEKLLENKADISIVVDTGWCQQYDGRYQHPIEEAEKVMVEDGKVTNISKTLNQNDTYGEFIGMMKLSKKGTEIFKDNYERVTQEYGNAEFHGAVSLEKAYLTDMLQELVKQNYSVSHVDIKGCWKELDTEEDFLKAEEEWAD